MVNNAIHEEDGLEFNSLANWPPMQTEQDWCDVISSAARPSNELHRRILWVICSL